MVTLSRRDVVAAAFCLMVGTGVVLAPPAHAYVGPGAGLTAIGTVLALLAAVLLAIVGFVWYPVKRLLRSRKASAPGTASAGIDSKSQSNET